MSSPAQNPTTQAINEIRTDEETRSDVEELAERDDQYGALARVMLAIADGEKPSREDCTESGLKSLTQLYDGGD